jgi:protoporphyrin/coproporphyrin ferrochelatase
MKNAKKALVLLNMGGPNDLTEVEVFLKNMFNDKHILSIGSEKIRKFVAGTITTLRVEKAQEIYRELGGKSPLVGHTNRLIKALESELEDFIIVSAMRYTPPFASEAIKTLLEHDLSQVYLLPMYPQHSTTTTASSVEDFIEQMDIHHLDVTTTIISSFYKNEHLNRGIVESIKQTCQGDNVAEVDLVFSAHGLPVKVVEKGDLYQKQVEAHIKILKNLLKKEGLYFNSTTLSYQSKVGPMAWIEPSLDQTLNVLKSGKHVLIYPLAFTIDNSETEYELLIEYKEIAEELGYEYYKVVPALNDHPEFVKAILDLIGETKES